MGVQKKYNYALQPMSKEKFVEIVTADQPDAPDYFTYDAVLNTRERLTLNETMSRNLTPLTLEEVLKLKEEGAQILDVRSPVDYEGAHLEGSINIGLGGKYATWAGTILDIDKSIVIISSHRFEDEAIMRLGRIGFDHIAGYLEGGMEALLDRPDILRRTERITAQSLFEKISSTYPPLILDVRKPGEWQLGRIERSINIPLNQIKLRHEEIPNDKEMVIYCSSGYRSSIAISILEVNNIMSVLCLTSMTNIPHRSVFVVFQIPT